MLYNLGRGVDENKELAYWWFSEAAEASSIKAINNLAVMYFNGNNYETRYLLKRLNYLKPVRQKILMPCLH